jgi:hypothetical protein
LIELFKEQLDGSPNITKVCYAVRQLKPHSLEIHFCKLNEIEKICEQYENWKVTYDILGSIPIFNEVIME